MITGQNSTEIKSAILTEAMAYSARGWSVFPVYGIDGETLRCLCGQHECTAAGKHPMIAGGVLSASNDPAVLREWFGSERGALANIGLATGTKSGITALDIDVGEGKIGQETWANLHATHGEPVTLMAQTGGGGFHVFFQYDQACKSKNNAFGPNVDCKNDGGYVVLAPSRHRSGERYTWINWGEAIAPIPAWLVPVETRGRPKKGDVRRQTFTLPEVAEMLALISADDRDFWRSVGIILGRTFDRSDLAWEVYQKWSATWGGARAANHDRVMHEAFYTLSALDPENQLSLGTIVRLAMDAGWTPKGGGTTGEPGLIKSLADEILRTEWFAQDAGEALWVYNGGRFCPGGASRVALLVKTLMDANGDSARWSSFKAREVAEYLRIGAPALLERPDPGILNLKNGLLDLATGTLSPHNPDHLSPVQLPISFDPSATCTLWEQFAARVLPDDCQNFPYELLASAMCGEVSDQMAVLLVGAGGNGKSTLLDAIVAALGRENVSTLALQRLEADKFAAVRLLGKLANVCADLPGEHLSSTSTFKSLTGGDRMTAERKFQGSFEFTPFARLIFSTNSYPQSKDNSAAFFRRWLVVPFDTVIEPRERVQNLAARLADSRELSGVLNRAIAHLAGGGGYSENETTRSAMMEFREMTDPLSSWLDKCTVSNPDGFVSKKDLAIAYNSACDTAGRPFCSAKAFHVAVRRLRPTTSETQRTIHGQVQWVFNGLAMVGTPSKVYGNDVNGGM